MAIPRQDRILDDSEARGFLFSYDKLFGATPAARGSRTLPVETAEEATARTRRLLYVTCTRAEKSLALMAYTKDPEALVAAALHNNWFTAEEIERL